MVSAAEQTVGLMVALARNIPQAHAALKQGRWERSKWGGVELQGKTLGVLGFGRIGQQVARRAVGLGMHVVAYDPFVADERFRELGVEHAATRGRRPRRRRLPHPALAADRRDPGHDQPRHDREDEGRRPDRQRRARRPDRRGGAGRGADVGQARRRRPRRLLEGAVRRPAPRARRRRRDAAPRRLDRRGPGPGGRDHRRAGRGGARAAGWSRTPSTSRSSTRRRSRCSARSSRLPPSSADSPSSSPVDVRAASSWRRTARWPTTTRASSRSRP